MADFYIVPPRLTVGTFDRANVVNSINSLKGDLSFVADPNSGVRILVSGDVLQFSIAQDYYVKKSGDTYTRNLLFRPDTGYYGVAVGFGSTTPGIGVTGSLYFDITTGLLNVHDGTTWNPISGNGIPQAAADLRYLKLDGTNTPTANISMDSYFLRLANLPTQALAGTAGQIFFNTTTGFINVYNGTQWNAVGLGITSITLGNGLYSATNPITSYGTITVDQSANFTWTGSHTFNNPVTFAAAGQSFEISKLYIPGQTQGDIIFFNSGAWTRFGIGSTSQALVVNSAGTGLTWGTALGSGSGISSLNNLTAGIQDFTVGYSGSTFNISSSGSTHTFNIPIAGIGATGLVSTLAQSFAGVKTFTSGIIGDLTGIATTAGLATTAANVNIVAASSNTNHPLIFTPSSGSISGAALSSNATVVFNPSTNILSVSGIAITSGTASTNSSTGALIVTGGVGIGGSLFVGGDLTINGNLTSINSTIVTVDDKNIELASTDTPSDAYAEGGGITLKGTTDKILAWYAGTGWSVNESFNLSSDNTFKINNTSVLSNTTLGTGVTNSSLTSVGTIDSGVWAGTAITSRYGGTGFTTYAKGDLLAGSGSSLVILPVGSNSYVLTADSSQPSGIKWAASSGGSGITINGLNATIQYFQVGTSGNSFNIASSGSTHTFNIPVAGTGKTGLITPDAQSLAGIKTFSNGVISSSIVSPADGLIGSDGTYFTTGGTAGTIKVGIYKSDTISRFTGIQFQEIISPTFGPGYLDGNIVFYTDSEAQDFSTERMRIDGKGFLTIEQSASIGGSLILGSPLEARYGGTGYTTFTKGDIIVGAGSTFIKLAVGTDGYVLGADSTSPAGLGWTTVSGVAISTLPPAGPKNTDLWFNSTDGSLSVYYQDIDTSQWVEIAIGSGIDLSNSVHITSTTGSTNTSTGALIVDGGVGVAGTVNAQSLTINGLYDQIGTTLTTSATTVNQVALTLNTSVYRSAKIFVQASTANTFHIQEILLLHDGTDVYMTEYAMVNSGAIGSTFDGDLSGGNMRFLVTPTYAATTYNISCSAMRI